jgi:hypothetical protein
MAGQAGESSVEWSKSNIFDMWVNLFKFLAGSAVFHNFLLIQKRDHRVSPLSSGGGCVRSRARGKPGPDPVSRLTKPGY